MSGKRLATSDLNHDNWDYEDNVEDAGTFKKANDEVLKGRVMRTAKRRNPTTSFEIAESGDRKSTAFGGFSGFAKTTSNPSTAFGFLNTSGSNKEVTKKLDLKTNKADTNGILQKPEIVKSSTFKSNCTDEYLAKLKGLNENVSKWIKQHVENNPFVNLMPVFKDYERYFDELEMKKKIIVNESTKNELNKFSFKSSDKAKDAESLFPTGLLQTNNADKNTSVVTLASTQNSENIQLKIDNKTQESQKFCFGAPTSASASSIDFGVPKSNMTPAFCFGGNNSTPFTFTNVAKPAADKNDDIIEINDDEPPKVEFTPVVENGHVYQTRCKVFVKKDGNFKDRGVGNLYLKPIPDSEKVQLIVRADTNLGNLLCNFVLTENIPTQRMGKKDVMLVCLPTPDFNPPPVPVLLRVKGSNEADALLKILEKHKKYLV